MKDSVKRSVKEWAEGVGVACYLLRGAHPAHSAPSSLEIASTIMRAADSDPQSTGASGD